MAFVSQLRSGIRKGRPGMVRFVSFRKTKSGATGGVVSKDIGLRGTRIDIQIDEENKTIRIGRYENGVKVNERQGSFSCSISVFEIVGNIRISLTDGNDGWWYGEY